MRNKIGILTGLAGIGLLAAGVMKTDEKEAKSVSVIGASDGPTSVFIAGKRKSNLPACLAAIGLVCIAVSGILLCLRSTE